MKELPTWTLVAAFGAAGTLLRYGAGLVFSRPGLFPWPTFVVNVAGCVAIGFLAAVFERTGWVAPSVRVALFIGLLGGFTTFSSIALEGLRLAGSGLWVAAAGYILLTNVVGFGAAWLGHAIGRVLCSG